jgi:Flp pilus assembly protein TadD
MYLPLMAIVALGVTSAGRLLMGRHVELAGRTRLRGVAASARQDGPPYTAPYKGAPYAAATVCVLLIAAVLSYATIQRNAEYLSGLTLWQSVLDRWPPHARAHRNLAAEPKLAGRRDEEIAHLRIAVADLPELRNLLGVELLSLGRNEEAASELQRYVRDHPRDADAWSSLGIALAATGRNDEAKDAFERAVTADPANARSQLNLALHLFQQSDFDGASAHARDAVRLEPGDPAAHNLLGLALVGQQKIDEAIAEFRASLALRPNDNDATGYLERTLKAAGRPAVR